ncbi:NAD-dependent epimerase/dehydratase family protein [Candidatus Peregrinibacteria bacterium]|nr:NAD-dependent epimerase/dehydratase family protein [Candidatus Peregrinibacteria bacterium]
MTINKILVTGSSGTIGTHLCNNLLRKGYDVVGVDWKPNEWSKEVDRLTINIDLRNKDDVLSKLPKDVDLVIHFAANPRVYNSVVDPSIARDNFETLFNTLEYARQNNVKRFMFSSSREAYGNSDKIIHNEDEAYVKNAESPYTATKIAGEAIVHSYQQCYNMDFVIFRFSNVYGMYDGSDRLIPLFIKQCKEGEDMTVFGDEKLLDFTYIDDTVNGVMLSIEKFNEVKNEVFNISCGKGSTILEVAEMTKKLMNSNNNIILKENRTGEVVKFIADITKAKEKLGYNPQTSIEDGLKKSIEWYSLS